MKTIRTILILILSLMAGKTFAAFDGAIIATGPLNDVKIHRDFFPKNIDTKATTPLLRLKAYFADYTSFDPTVVYFNSKATTGFDSNYDALKLYNTDANIPNLYSISTDSVKMSINGMPDPGEILFTLPLGLKIAKSEYVIFKIKDLQGTFTEKTITFIDVVAGTSEVLTTDTEYKIYLEAGEYTDRFSIIISKLETEIPEFRQNNWFSIYSSHGELMSEINLPIGEKGTLMIINMQGQLSYIANVKKQGYNEFYPGIKDGFYIIILVSGSKKVFKKIFFSTR